VHPKLQDSLLGTLKNFLQTRSREVTEDCKTLFETSPTSENLAEYLRKFPVSYRELFLDISRFFLVLLVSNSLAKEVFSSITSSGHWGQLFSQQTMIKL